MADLTITAASVVAGTNSQQETGTAGEAITAGQVVYRDSTRKWKLADSDSDTDAARRATGIALNGAAANQPITVHRSGDITIGATLTAGTAYYLSATAGGICPVADVGAGESVCLLGLAKSTALLAVDIQFPGVEISE